MPQAKKAPVVAADGAAPARRRRRRTTSPNPTVLSNLIISSMLKNGSATHSAMESVLEWARGVSNEAESLKELQKRPRRAKAEGMTERLATLELNKALLQGVLSGEISVNVDDAGDIVFEKA